MKKKSGITIFIPANQITPKVGQALESLIVALNESANGKGGDVEMLCPRCGCYHADNDCQFAGLMLQPGVGASG